MQRFHQLVFVFSFVALSWYVTMSLHELGHVLGAALTGGSVQRVVLHPLAISRTDVSPNPHPAIVVWFGPLAGCLLPLVALALIPASFRVARHIVRFVAGFSLIANGAYISIGSFGRVGDCAEMLRSGTPLWLMIAFGVATVPAGLYLWHGLGSVRHCINYPALVSTRLAYGTLAVLLVVCFAGFVTFYSP